jgi:hypothetical protein
MPNKRRRDDIDSLVESVPLDNELLDGLRELNHDELTAVLAHVANEASISTVTPIVIASLLLSTQQNSSL